jgi:hypothetical protein
MKKACDAAAFDDQTVVLVDRGRGLVAYDGDLMFLEKRESRRRGLEAKLTTSTQHDDVGLVLEQLDEVGCLNTGSVLRTRLVPIPAPGSTGPELRVPQLPDAFDLDGSPRVVMHRG